MSGRGWLADVDSDVDGPYAWQPCLDTGNGLVTAMQVLFRTKEECEEFIRDSILGASVLLCAPRPTSKE